MTLDTKTIIEANLGTLFQEAQQLILDGWRVKLGYPIQVGWRYELMLEKPLEQEAPRKAGRQAAPK